MAQEAVVTRVAYVSHSLIATRQEWFAAELRHQLEAAGGALFELYPDKWGNHDRAGGYAVWAAGDQIQYSFPVKAWRDLREWKPDVVLLQQEPYCLTSYQAYLFCKRLGIPYVIFTWENQNPPMGPGMEVLANASTIVCGNTDAQTLIATTLRSDECPSEPWAGKTVILPQVGIDPHAFAPKHVAKDWDLIYMGRKNEPMKGEAILDQAVTGKPWRVAKGHELGFASYSQLPDRYSRAQLQCVPSHDVPNRPREQFAPATTIEGFLCGVPVVTTDQSAIREWLRDCPGKLVAKQGDAQDLRHVLEGALEVGDPYGLERRGRRAREWALERFTNEVVARKYVGVLSKCSTP